MAPTHESTTVADLEIYRLAHDLGYQAHLLSLRLLKFELYESGSQLRRAAKSVSANIVEGYGRRRYKAEFIKFLIYAQASCDETGEWLKYIGECHEQLVERTEELQKERLALAKKINRFIQAVETGHRPVVA